MGLTRTHLNPGIIGLRGYTLVPQNGKPGQRDGRIEILLPTERQTSTTVTMEGQNYRGSVEVSPNSSVRYLTRKMPGAYTKVNGTYVLNRTLFPGDLIELPDGKAFILKSRT